MPAVTLKQLLEAGVHFGHQTSRWNPKMKPFIFTARNGIHMIDLEQTVKLLENAHRWVIEQVATGGSILFVGTKKQAQAIIEEEAKRGHQFYVNHRWMGGMLTNFQIIQQRFSRMHDLREIRDTGGFEHLTKKDAAKLEDELDRLERNFSGMAGMKKLPAAVFVVDPRKEHIAVTEARKLKIPVIAITDSNCDPDLVDFVIPGNDDAIRAVRLITSRIAEAGIEGWAMIADSETEEAEGADKDDAVEAERELVPAGVAAAAGVTAGELQAAPPAAPEAPTPAPVAPAAPAPAETVAEVPAAPAAPAVAAPDADDAAVETTEAEIKPGPEVDEEEFAKELEGLDEQDKMMGDA
jgi:small subunit ribosomal protein S2